MTNKALFLFIFIHTVLSCAFSVHAQNLKSESDLKKQAEKLFAARDFLAAAPLYSELLSVNTKNADYNYKYGACAIYSEMDKSKSLKYLELASKTNGINDDVFYFLGRSYHLNYRFDEAIAAYENYKKLARAADIEKNNVNRLIEMCSNGKKVYTESIILDVVEQKQFPVSGLFSGYELNALGGKILSTPIEFKSKIDKKKEENSTIYLSKENLTVYYSSYGDNESNGKDIYKMVQLPTMEYSKPENLGPALNTPYREDYPFIHADGKTLYFCSEGHNSIGGLDIFKSEFNEDTKTWSAPENLGYPINSAADDIFYATGTAEPEFAYFASNRETVFDQVIVYKIKLKTVLASFTTIKGQFSSVDQKDLKLAKITIFNLENKELVGTYSTNASSADYLIKVAPGEEYTFVVEAEGYLPHSENITIPAQSESSSLKQEIKLSKDATGEEMRVSTYPESKAGSENTVENIQPKEVVSTFKYDQDYKDKLTPVEIDGQIIYVTPPTVNAPTTTTSTEPVAAKSDYKEDISNNDIIKIAYEDAKESETEAINIKKDAEIASEIATQRDSLAKVKGQESQLAMANAQKISDKDEKQNELNRAKELEEEANKMAREAEVASQMASRLGEEARLKQLESDSAYANAKALDAAILNNDQAGNLALSNKIKRKKSQSVKKPKSGSINDKSYLKKREAESELAYSERLTKESDSLMLQSAAIKEKAANTTNSKEREGLLKESVNIENTAIAMQKSARQCLVLANQIRDSIKTSEMASTIAKEVEQSNEKKDEAAPLISIVSAEPSVPPVSGDTATATAAIAPVEEPKTALPNITASQPVEIAMEDPRLLNSTDPNFPAYVSLYEEATQNKQASDSTLAIAKKSKLEADSLFAKFDIDREKAFTIKKKKLQQEALTNSFSVEIAAKQKQADADSSFARSQRYAQLATSKQKESVDLLSKIPKAPAEPVTVAVTANLPVAPPADSSSVNQTAGQAADPATTVSAVNTEVPLNKIEAINNDTAIVIDTTNTEIVTNAVNPAEPIAAGTQTPSATATAIDIQQLDKYDPNYSKYRLLDSQATEKQIEADTVSAWQIAKQNEATTLADEAARLREEAPKLKKSKERKLQLATADKLEAQSKLKQASADSLSVVAKNITQEAQLKHEEANAVLPSIALLKPAPVASTIPSDTTTTSQLETNATTNPSAVAQNIPGTSTPPPANETPVTVNPVAADSNSIATNTGIDSTKAGEIANTILTNQNTKEMDVVKVPAAIVPTTTPIPAIAASENPIPPVETITVFKGNEKTNAVFGASSEPVYDDKNPIPFDVPLPEGLIFKVQIGAFKNPIPQNTFGGIRPITGEKTANGLTKYTAGLFIAFETADLVKKEIRSLGYKDAFIVAFYKGKRIPIYEAADIVKEYSLLQKLARRNAIREEIKVLKSINIYREKYGKEPEYGDLAANTGTTAPSVANAGVSTQPLKYNGLIYTVQIGVYRSANLPGKFRNIRPVNRDQLQNGLYRYTSGVYNYFAAADSAKNAIKGTVPDAFVITLFKGQAITAVEGKRLEKTVVPVKIEPQPITNTAAVQTSGIVYKVQVGAFKSQVPFEMVDMYIKIKDKQLTNKINNGLTVFYVGELKEFEAAEKLKNEVIEVGLKDAFIVAFDGDKQISLDEAKEQLNK